MQSWTKFRQAMGASFGHSSMSPRGEQQGSLLGGSKGDWECKEGLGNEPMSPMDVVMTTFPRVAGPLMFAVL